MVLCLQSKKYSPFSLLQSRLCIFYVRFMPFSVIHFLFFSLFVGSSAAASGSVAVIPEAVGTRTLEENPGRAGSHVGGGHGGGHQGGGGGQRGRGQVQHDSALLQGHLHQGLQEDHRGGLPGAPDCVSQKITGTGGVGGGWVRSSGPDSGSSALCCGRGFRSVRIQSC